ASAGRAEPAVLSFHLAASGRELAQHHRAPVRHRRAAFSRGLSMTVPLRRYQGVFPVVPTTFDEQGGLDLASQMRCVDFMIDAGAEGLCILANFSEQFGLSDEERRLLTEGILRHVAGRVPVIVTTTH